MFMGERSVMYESMAAIALKSCTGVVMPGSDVLAELGC